MNQTADQTAKFRPHSWINTKTLKPIYGVQARVGKNGWAHVHESGKPLLFDTARERDAALKELNS